MERESGIYLNAKVTVLNEIIASAWSLNKYFFPSTSLGVQNSLKVPEKRENALSLFLWPLQWTDFQSKIRIDVLLVVVTSGIQCSNSPRRRFVFLIPIYLLRSCITNSWKLSGNRNQFLCSHFTITRGEDNACYRIYIIIKTTILSTVQVGQVV